MALVGQAQPFNRMQPKKGASNKLAHTANTQYGQGDFVGQAIKAKVGRMKKDSMGFSDITPHQLKTAPKALA